MSMKKKDIILVLLVVLSVITFLEIGRAHV